MAPTTPKYSSPAKVRLCIRDTCALLKMDSGGTTVIGTYDDDLLVTETSTERVDPFFRHACT